MEKKRLDHDDRINLQAGMAKGHTLARIAKDLGKSRSTVHREIISNCTYRDCRHTCAHCKKRCDEPSRAAKFDRGRCAEFAAGECPRWRKFPYTCNGCPEAQFCRGLKRYYDCIDADESSERRRREPRTFKGIGGEDLGKIDAIVSAGVENG